MAYFVFYFAQPPLFSCGSVKLARLAVAGLAVEGLAVEGQGRIRLLVPAFEKCCTGTCTSEHDLQIQKKCCTKNAVQDDVIVGAISWVLCMVHRFINTTRGQLDMPEGVHFASKSF